MQEDARIAAVAGRFTVGEILEQGSSWTACRATEIGDGRAVVLRIVEDDRLAQEANAQRFLSEARLIATLEHPSLVPLRDAGVAGRFGWIASDSTSGLTLRELLSRGRFSFEDAARAGEQIAAALDAVHARGLVHRDLRPELVVQVAPGAFRIGGFGLGRWMMAGARRTDGTAVAGVPAVLSPELVTGGAATVATDIHALGLLLFEMVTGEHAYAAPTLDEQLERLARSYPLRPSALAPAINAPLEEVILRALAKDPASRQLTARAVQQALALCPGGSGAPTEPETRRRTIPTWAEMITSAQGPLHRMKRAAMYIAPLVLVAALLVGLLRTRVPTRAEEPMDQARRQFSLHPRDAALRVQFGEQLERMGRVDDARKLFDEALQLDPGYARAICGHARIQDREGRRDEARRTYRRAIAADPRAWYAVLELARLLKQDTRHNEARVLLEEGLAASPAQPDLKEELAHTR